MSISKRREIIRRGRRRLETPDRRRGAAASSDFRALIDEAVQGIIIHRNFKPLYANQAFAELFGYSSAEEILKLPILRPLIPEDLWPRLESEYDEMMRGSQKSSIGRSRGVKKDGQEIWVAVTLHVINWMGLPAMMLTAYDVTRQVNVEFGLLNNEQKLRSILEVLPYPVYVARKTDGQIIFVNRKTCLLFQKSASQLLKMKSLEFYVNISERDEMIGLLDKISDVRDMEVHMKTSHGREFIAELAAISIDYDGSPAVMVALNDISQRKEMEAELFRQAHTDSLTGINNRRSFETLSEQEFRRARRFERDMTIMMIDIDHFKHINDTYGHAVGDKIIQGVVKRSLESLRQSDAIGRMGGEEFAVILPETPLSAALEVAERLRKHIQEKPFVADHKAIPCTVSIGIAQLGDKDSCTDDILKKADDALYKAKESGRNRVISSEEHQNHKRNIKK